MGNTQIISFPEKARRNPKRREKRIINIDGIKYYNKDQIRLLRRTVRDQAVLDREQGKVTGIREWMAIDILTSTGARVAEAANIRCNDLKLGYSLCEVFIREGKGSRSRTIEIPESLKKHLKQFLKWKRDRQELVEDDDHLFIGQRGPWTSQAVQQIVKKYLKSLGLYESGKSAHALRHSYGVEFYGQEKDLKALQKQLGHASIQTTQIYADVTKADIQNQLKGFWN